MRISIGIGGDVLGAPIPPAAMVEQAVAAEAAGFPAAWTTHFSRGTDSLGVLAVAATRTSRIDLGVGVVPTYPRHPLALAQQAATVQALAGGRLTLGVGPSHRPVIEGLHGLPYASPAAHLRDYLSVLVPLLREGAVTYAGEHYRVDGGFTIPGTAPVEVVVGALGPRLVGVAGELSDGVVTWLAGPRTLGDEIGPGLRAAAERAGRRPPRLVAGVPVAVHDDEDEVRAAAAEQFARYGGLENYRRLFEREGVGTPEELAVAGTAAEVEARLRRLADAGVTEVWATVFPVGADAAASTARTTEVLAGLAARSG